MLSREAQCSSYNKRREGDCGMSLKKKIKVGYTDIKIDLVKRNTR